MSATRPTGHTADEQLLATYADPHAPAAERQAAFEVLVRRFQRRVFAVCVRVLGSPEDAEEATQETFVKLARSASTFRGDAALSTWLFRVARNVCTDHVRRDARRPSTPVEDIEQADHRTGVDPTGAVDAGDEIGRALAQLDPVSRQLVLLVGVDGWSYADAGSAFDLPVGTVKSRVSRARVRLGELLAEGAATGSPATAAHDHVTDDGRRTRGDAPRGPPGGHTDP